MSDDPISCLAESAAIAERVIAQIPPEYEAHRNAVVARHWPTFSDLVCRLMKCERQYEAFIYSERAKALAFLPELSLPCPPRDGTQALVALSELVSLLPDDETAVLAFFWGEHEAFGWVLRRGGFPFPCSSTKWPWLRGGPITPHIGQRPFLDGLSIQVHNAFRGRFDSPSGKHVFGAGRDLTLDALNDWHQRREKTEINAEARLFHPVGLANHVAAGLTLYTVLVQRAQPALEGVKRIVVIPDGPLHYVPFEALIQGEPLGEYLPPSDDTDFLVKQYVFSYLPSVYALYPIHRGEQIRRGVGGGQFIGFGNPILPQSLLSRRHGIDLLPIPSTEDEIRIVAQMFHHSKCFLGPSATKQMFLKEAPGATHLHVATHGILSDDHPENSALVFSSDADDPRLAESEALLTCDEIRQLRLDAELVVLSACGSGLGKYRRGQGIQGLAQAFRQAGARSLLASLWIIADEPTVSFMREFYAGIVSGTSVSAACTAAKRRMAKRYPDPFYWAPFVVRGAVT